MSGILQIVDLLVRFLKTKLPSGDMSNLVEKLHIEALSVLETYLMGNSRKNELYFTKHIEYFNTQFSIKVWDY